MSIETSANVTELEVSVKSNQAPEVNTEKWDTPVDDTKDIAKQVDDLPKASDLTKSDSDKKSVLDAVNLPTLLGGAIGAAVGAFPRRDGKAYTAGVACGLTAALIMPKTNSEKIVRDTAVGLLAGFTGAAGVGEILASLKDTNAVDSDDIVETK